MRRSSSAGRTSSKESGRNAASLAHSSSVMDCVPGWGAPGLEQDYEVSEHIFSDNSFAASSRTGLSASSSHLLLSQAFSSQHLQPAPPRSISVTVCSKGGSAAETPAPALPSRQVLSPRQSTSPRPAVRSGSPRSPPHVHVCLHDLKDFEGLADVCRTAFTGIGSQSSGARAVGDIPDTVVAFAPAVRKTEARRARRGVQQQQPSTTNNHHQNHHQHQNPRPSSASGDGRRVGASIEDHPPHPAPTRTAGSVRRLSTPERLPPRAYSVVRSRTPLGSRSSAASGHLHQPSPSSSSSRSSAAVPVVTLRC